MVSCGNALVRHFILTCPVDDCPPSFIHHPGKTGSFGVPSPVCKYATTHESVIDTHFVGSPNPIHKNAFRALQKIVRKKSYVRPGIGSINTPARYGMYLFPHTQQDDVWILLRMERTQRAFRFRGIELRPFRASPRNLNNGSLAIPNPRELSL